ncbi:MAG: DUF58 domain-containing protein [Actinomycetota bacterium]|nr:DUF58 domain-containing protein [Actinomycetota bacterium]
MTRRPTPKAAVVAAVGGLLIAVGTTAQAGWMFVLAAGVLGLVTSALLTPHRLAAATVMRSVPERVRVGETVPVEVSLKNASAKRLPPARVEVRCPAFETTSLACEAVAPGATATVEVARVALRRGVFDGSEVTVSSSAPFGFVRSKKELAVASRVIVHPQVVAVDDLPLPETPAATADQALAVARSGHGDVFAGVREYRPGDQRRLIHWRSTARAGTLVVREQEEQAKSPVVLVVGSLPAEEPGDRVAAAAASVGLHALAAGRTVHCAGRGLFGDLVENASELSVLDWAAALEGSGFTAADGVSAAHRSWGRRCAFVVFESEPGSSRDAIELALSHGSTVQLVRATAA